MPLIERVATVTGEKIKNPGNFIIKIGTSVKELMITAVDLQMTMFWSRWADL